jgi:hypothetical protein
MKKLIIKTYRAEMQLLKASEAQQQLVINNIQLYNSLVENFQKGEKANQYLIYQLNIAINRQMADLLKVSDRAKENKARAKERQAALKLRIEAKAKKDGDDDEDDYFNEVIRKVNEAKNKGRLLNQK